MRNRQNKARRLRGTVETLPRHTREAMLRGIDGNQIIVGAYTDRDGGVCPMLAAHRNGGRTNFASFARAWDEFTGDTRRPRKATRREVRTLRSYIEVSILRDDAAGPSLVDAAAEIRNDRRSTGPAAPDSAASTQGTAEPQPLAPPASSARTDRFRVRDLRGRHRRSKERARLDVYEATLAATREQR